MTAGGTDGRGGGASEREPDHDGTATELESLQGGEHVDLLVTNDDPMAAFVGING